MLFHHMLTPEHVCVDDASQSKTAVLKKVSQIFGASTPELSIQTLFEAYWKRENLGSFAIGNGIIIPHIRLPSLTMPKTCFIKLKYPVDFGAQDKQPADLVIGLLAPLNQNQQHLNILSSIVKQFSDADFRKACRNLNDRESLYALITEEPVLSECL